MWANIGETFRRTRAIYPLATATGPRNAASQQKNGKVIIHEGKREMRRGNRTARRTQLESSESRWCFIGSLFRWIRCEFSRLEVSKRSFY